MVLESILRQKYDIIS